MGGRAGAAQGGFHAHLLVLGLDELRELADAEEVLGARLAGLKLAAPLLRCTLGLPELRIECCAGLGVVRRQPADMERQMNAAARRVAFPVAHSLRDARVELPRRSRERPRVVVLHEAHRGSVLSLCVLALAQRGLGERVELPPEELPCGDCIRKLARRLVERLGARLGLALQAGDSRVAA